MDRRRENSDGSPLVLTGLAFECVLGGQQKREIGKSINMKINLTKDYERNFWQTKLFAINYLFTFGGSLGVVGG